MVRIFDSVAAGRVGVWLVDWSDAVAGASAAPGGFVGIIAGHGEWGSWLLICYGLAAA